MKNAKVFITIVFLTVIAQSNAKSQHINSTLFASEAERCIVPASQFHGVNAFILRAILRVESGLKSGAIGKNGNGTVDVGIGQMNSMHFPALAKFGVGPEELKNACIGTYVAAWQLKKGMTAHGNTWEAIARYHSGTPYFNKRYQILLSNELIRSKVLIGMIQAVPPLRQN
jgi:soluble lytic murein transglycosylase-like protein